MLLYRWCGWGGTKNLWGSEGARMWINYGIGFGFGVSLVSSCLECNCDLVIDECLSKNILRVCLPGTSFCLLFQGTPYLRFLCLFGY